jgi:hypothetical protein
LRDDFSGFLPQPPDSSGGLRRGFTFGLPAHRSFLDKRKFMERARKPYIPGLMRPGLYGQTGKQLIAYDSDVMSWTMARSATV